MSRTILPLGLLLVARGRKRALRVPFPLVLICALGLSGCPGSDPAGEREKLRNYLTERVRKRGWRDLRTDEDSRARPPTKYAEATRGLSFAIRHRAKFEDHPVTMSTWVYRSRKARDAAKAPFQAIVDDLSREPQVLHMKALDFAAPELHLYLLMESPGLALANEFQFVTREIVDRAAELKEMK